MAVGRATPLHRRPLDGHFTIIGRAGRPGLFFLLLDGFLFMEDDCTKILDSGGTPGLSSPPGVGGCDARKGELARYPHDDNANDWYFADVPVNSYIDVHASLRQYFEAIHYFCHLANVSVPQDTNRGFQSHVADYKRCRRALFLNCCQNCSTGTYARV